MEYRETPRTHDPLVVAFNGRVMGLERDTGKIRWEHQLPSAGMKIAIAIHDARVYATGSHHIGCYDVVSGDQVWVVKRSFSGRAGVIVQDGKVFVGCSGEVECFDFAGKQLWANGMSGKGYGEMSLGFEGNVVQADINT